MRGVAEVPAIRELLIDAGIDHPEEGFEAAYSQLRADPNRSAAADDIDAAVREHFADVEIPGAPTIYDLLLLGLRKKDLVATFNWDPLLAQAHNRLISAGASGLPEIVYLHGNVGISVCLQDRTTGPPGLLCPTCDRPLGPVPLLYPVTEKNYEANDFIKYAWAQLRWGLRNAVLVTIFGYRAPVSDVAAIREFQAAWGTPDERPVEQFELIGRPGSDPEQLRARWDRLIHTHHFTAIDDFFDSWIANHPRRTAECWYWQHVEGNFIDVNPVPRQLGLEQTVAWYGELRSHERRMA